MNTIKILIVDDRDIIRDSIKLSLLNSKEMKVTGEASDGLEAVNLVKNNEYDLVLMDINMPKMDGMEATKKIINLKPNVKILAHSFNDNAYYILDIIKSGASGYIKKGDTYNTYMKAIKQVYNGGFFLSDEIIDLLYDEANYTIEEESLEK